MVQNEYRSVTRPAHRTIFLFYRPIPNASAMKDMPAFQHYRFFRIEVFQANSASSVLTLHNKRFVGIINLAFSHVVHLIALVNWIDSNIRVCVDLWDNWRVLSVPVFS